MLSLFFKARADALPGGAKQWNILVHQLWLLWDRHGKFWKWHCLRKTGIESTPLSKLNLGVAYIHLHTTFSFCPSFSWNYWSKFFLGNPVYSILCYAMIICVNETNSTDLWNKGVSAIIDVSSSHIFSLYIRLAKPGCTREIFSMKGLAGMYNAGRLLGNFTLESSRVISREHPGIFMLKGPSF